MPAKRGDIPLTSMPLIEEHPIFILIQLPMSTLYPRVAHAAAEALVNEHDMVSHRFPEATVAYNELLALMHYSAMGIATLAFQEFSQQQLGRLHYAGITLVDLQTPTKPITELVTLGLETPAAEFVDTLERITAIQQQKRALPSIQDVPADAYMPLDCFYSVPDLSTAMRASTWEAVKDETSRFAIVTLTVKTRYSSVQVPAQKRIMLNTLAAAGRYCLASFLPDVPCPLDLLQMTINSMREEGNISDKSWWLPVLQLLHEQEWLTVLPEQSDFIVTERAHRQLYQSMEPDIRATMMPFVHARIALRNASIRCVNGWLRENNRPQMRQALPHLAQIAQTFIDAVTTTNTPPGMEDILFIMQVGEACLRCQKTREAQRLVEMALAFTDMSPQPHTPMLKAQCYESLGDIHWKRKQQATARKYWQMALDVAPDFTIGQEALQLKLEHGLPKVTAQQAS